MTPAQPRFGLIDCNNFFVSCERLFRPDLRRRPVVVLSSNDGCVVARSQEVKDNGIPMGAPYFQVKDTLSDMGAAVFSSHFSLYRDVSRRVFSVIRRELGQIEQYSIDEAFFIVDDADAVATAERIRAIVFREVGIPVSVGIGLSRTQAKYANAVAKKTTGTYELTHESFEATANSIKLGDIWGVGRARVEEFRGHGLTTVAEYLALPRGLTRQLFGVEGERLWAELRGEVPRVLSLTHELQKTIMSTRSFAVPTTSKMVLKDALIYHVSEIVDELGRKKALAATLRVLAYPSRFSDYAFSGMSVEAALVAPTRDIFVLERQIETILSAHFKPGVPYKKAGVVVGVVASAAMTDSLFPSPEEQRTKALTETLLSINRKQGRGVLMLGRVGQKQSAWRAKTDALSPNYTTDWKSLCVVKA